MSQDRDIAEPGFTRKHGSVRCERDGPVALVTLDAPEELNALSSEMMQALADLWPELDGDDRVRAIVLTGAGRGFCSGLRAQQIDIDPAARPSAYPRFTPHDCGSWKPFLVAINGVCASGGLHFLAHATIALASEEASFLDTHTSVGQVSGLEAACLARRIPLEAVLRMIALGRHERLDAKRALELGLVSEVLPRDALLPRALELAGLIARNSPAALERSLRALWQGLDRGLSEALAAAWEEVVAHRAHPDAREGGKAFLERRDPSWVDDDGHG
jgi:enoyl-CoA hydratase/carnithine racemase